MMESAVRPIVSPTATRRRRDEDRYCITLPPDGSQGSRERIGSLPWTGRVGPFVRPPAASRSSGPPGGWSDRVSRLLSPVCVPFNATPAEFTPIRCDGHVTPADVPRTCHRCQEASRACFDSVYLLTLIRAADEQM